MKRLVVTTPELVPLELRIAGVGERGLAWLLDEAAILAAVGVLWFLAGLVGVVTGGLGLLPAFAAIIVVRFVLSIGYRVWAETRRRGQTWGKQVMGLRTVQNNAAPLHVWQSMLRNLARGVDELPALSLLGAVFVVLDPQGRRIGDHLAGTVVIRERRHAAPRALRVLAGEQNSIAQNTSAAARIRRRLTAREAALLGELIVAAPRIDVARRLELTRRIAAYYRRALGLEAHRALPDEALLRGIVGVVARDRFGAPAAGVARGARTG